MRLSGKEQLKQLTVIYHRHNIKGCFERYKQMMYREKAIRERTKLEGAYFMIEGLK